MICHVNQDRIKVLLHVLVAGLTSGKIIAIDNHYTINFKSFKTCISEIVIPFIDNAQVNPPIDVSF